MCKPGKIAPYKAVHIPRLMQILPIPSRLASLQTLVVPQHLVSTYMQASYRDLGELETCTFASVIAMHTESGSIYCRQGKASVEDSGQSVKIWCSEPGTCRCC